MASKSSGKCLGRLWEGSKTDPMPSKTFPEPLGNHCDQLLPLTMPPTLSQSSAICLHSAPHACAYHSSVLPQVLVNIIPIMSIATGAIRASVALVTLRATIMQTMNSANGATAASFFLALKLQTSWYRGKNRPVQTASRNKVKKQKTMLGGTRKASHSRGNA